MKINIDDSVFVGHLFYELVRRIPAGTLVVNPHWVDVRRILCEEPCAVRDNVAASRVIYPRSGPVPLALRDELSDRLEVVRRELNPPEPTLLVIDAWPVELHGVPLPPDPTGSSIATRRLPSRPGGGPTVAPPELDSDMAINTVYQHLLRQFFSHAEAITVKRFEGRTTYDVFRVMIQRKGHPAKSLFVKFGPPERLEREAVNCNRLLSAAAGDRDSNEIRLRRFFGYSHLSDSKRVIVESHGDFLALFVSTFHPLSPVPLSQFPFDSEPLWRTQKLIGDVCASLALLQGQLSIQSSPIWVERDQLPYDDFHRCGRVAELKFDNCQVANDFRPPPSARRPETWPDFHVDGAELVSMRGDYALQCYVSVPDDKHFTVERSGDRDNIELRGGSRIRLLFRKGSDANFYKGAKAVIDQALRYDIRVGGRVEIKLNELARNLLANRKERLKDLVQSPANISSPFEKLSDEERQWVIDELHAPLDDLDRIEETGRSDFWRVVAERIHGDFYLPNVLYGATQRGKKIDLSIIDFEQMRFGAPAAWDYAILELSLRIHWLLDNKECFEYLASPNSWSYRLAIFDGVRHRLEYVESRLAFQIGRNTQLPSPAPKAPQFFEHAVHALSLCAANIRSRFLSVCETRIGSPLKRDEVVQEYNQTLRLAAACQALWRRPRQSEPSNERRLVVKTILMAIISRNAGNNLYTP